MFYYCSASASYRKIIYDDKVTCDNENVKSEDAFKLVPTCCDPTKMGKSNSNI